MWRTEQLMLQGYSSARQLRPLLEETDIRRVNRYIKRVHARWEIAGGPVNERKARGQSIARFEALLTQLYDELGNCSSNTERFRYLSAIFKTGEKLDALKGLTPEVIARINKETPMPPNMKKQLEKAHQNEEIWTNFIYMLEEAADEVAAKQQDAQTDSQI